MIRLMSTPGPAVGRRDVVITAVLAVASIVLVGWLQDGGRAGTLAAADPVAGLASLAYTVPVLWRRRHPLLAAVGSSAGLAVHVAVFGSLTRCGFALPLLFVEAFAVGAWLELREALAGLALLLASSAVMLSQDASAGWSGLTVAVPGILALLIVGRIVRSRAKLAERLQAHTVELREAREANARMEVATDRVRLSAELDELLRSRLAHLAELADAGAGDDASEALRRIETESRSTLDQMRAVVGVLRGDEAPGTTPQPTLTQLDALLLRAKGTDARLRVTGNPRVLPAGLELSAYRVVEHLLATTEDAPGVEVAVDFGADALEVTVSGPARRRADAALERAAERVALQRGTLSSSTRDGRTEARAAFPVLVPA